MSLPSIPFPQGSIWRRWDLHVHTPASEGYTGTYDELINYLKNAEADVIGINDYCTVQGYEEIINRGGIPGKVLFPVVELRMHNIISNRKGTATSSGKKINFHIIFNNDDKVFRKVKNWLTSLQCYNAQSNTDLLGNIEKEHLQRITFQFEDVIKSLTEVGLRENVLIWLPYDEYGGIDDIDPSDNFFKLGLIKKADIIGSSTEKQIDFFLWKHPKYSIDDYKKWGFEWPMPCIKGCDSHKAKYPFGRLMDDKSNPIERFCWIKADPTFEGLKQITNEPERVYIGLEPEKIADVRNNKSKYIESIEMRNLNASAKPSWFDSQLPLNTGLVAIIGKKGSGKSALADIISLTGKSSVLEEHYSFLKPSKFRKRPGLAKDYESNITWVDTKKSSTTLEKKVEITEVEKVKYLPQEFVEKICNEEGVSTMFQQEIDNVIFSYVPETERNDASTLGELIQTKTDVIDEAIESIRDALSETNFDIVKLESKKKLEYKKKLIEKLAEKKRELLNIEKTKPKVVPKPKQDQNGPVRLKWKELTEKVSKVDEEIIATKASLTEVNTNLTKLSKIEQYIVELKTKYKAYIEKLEGITKGLSVDIRKIIKLEVDSTSIVHEKTRLIKQKEQLDKKLENNPNSKVSLIIARETLVKELEGITKALSADEKAYSNYLEKLKIYTNKKAEIEGKAGDKSLETIKSLEEEIKYLENELESALNSLYEKKTSLVKNIFKKVKEKISFYLEIYKPLNSKIKEQEDKQKQTGNVLKFNAGIVFDKQKFTQEFLSYINQQKDGSFQGKESGFKMIKALVDKYSFETEDQVVAFIQDIFDHLTLDKTKDKTKETDIDNQINGGEDKKIELLNFIHGLQYLEVKYKILFNGKDLNDNEFSPGEKGALLLIFYLLIDKSNIPLVMDQPEENLDNESVFSLLVPYIKEIKKRRQIIIVTHNPNLAVVCDAEQIICASMNKKTNEIRYFSGSIENPDINKKIVDVLEGTMPAFRTRDIKYIR